MQNYNVLIDDSALPIESKNELKRLAQQLQSEASANEKLTAEMFKAKAGINERQYTSRLRLATTDEQRNAILIEQFAWRDWFGNAVLRAHEARRRLQSLTQTLASQIAALNHQSDPAWQTALVALSWLIRTAGVSDADSVLKELDSVKDVDRNRILGSIRSIFQNKRDGSGVFAATNYSSQPFELLNAGEEQKSLSEASTAAIAAYHNLSAVSGHYLSVRPKLNVPQFTQRLEEALSSSDLATFDKISAEQRNIEAAVYVTAQAYEKGFASFYEAKQRLAEAIRVAAAKLSNGTDLDTIKAMSNCNGAWHWLFEMGYVEGFYVRQDLTATLRELSFDASGYISA